jgi:hypothetical protein
MAQRRPIRETPIMSHSKAQIDEARRLAKQAEDQVTIQLQIIQRMKRAELSTAVAEEALRMMTKIVEQMHARLKSMTGTVSGD